MGGRTGSIVLSMLYSEGLFCALAIWSLIALVEQRWLTAAGLTVLAGTVRSSALALVAAVTVAARPALIRALRERVSIAPRGGADRPRCCWPPSACPATGGMWPGRCTGPTDGSGSKRTRTTASTGDRAQCSS